MPALRIAVDLRGIDPDRTGGPARHARSLLAALIDLAPGHEWLVRERGGSTPDRVDVELSLVPGRALPGPRTVAAVYDLGHLVRGAPHGPLEWAGRNLAGAVRARLAGRVLAPSRLVAHQLTALLKVPESRVTWLPSIAPAGWTRARRAEVEELREELDLPARYLVFAGTLRRRKNLGVLARAWERVAHGLPGTALVAAGRAEDPTSRDELLAAGARWLGPVDDRVLRSLLSGAHGYFNPSLYEGSSIGALEAMACGAPPVVSEGTAAAEVVGSAGIVLPAASVDAWAQAIVVLCERDSARREMGRRGIQAVVGLRAEDSARTALAALEATALPAASAV